MVHALRFLHSIFALNAKMVTLKMSFVSDPQDSCVSSGKARENGLQRMPVCGIISAGFVEHYTRIQKSVEAADYKSSSAVIIVNEASPYISRTIKEVEDMNEVCVTALIRGELVVIPEDTIKVENGDVLLILKL